MPSGFERQADRRCPCRAWRARAPPCTSPSDRPTPVSTSTGPSVSDGELAHGLSVVDAGGLGAGDRQPDAVEQAESLIRRASSALALSRKNAWGRDSIASRSRRRQGATEAGEEPAARRPVLRRPRPSSSSSSSSPRKSVARLLAPGLRPARRGARRHATGRAACGSSSASSGSASLATATTRSPSSSWMTRTPWAARPVSRMSLTLMRISMPALRDQQQLVGVGDGLDARRPGRSSRSP